MQPTDGVTTFTDVTGLLDGNQITLTPYVDTLPIPSRVVVDTDNIVPFTDPIMFTVIGNAYSTNGPPSSYTVQYVQPGTLPIPNKLTVWVDEIGFNLVNVTLTIIGEVFPASPWVSEQRITSEILRVTTEWATTSVNRWSSISQIAIRNLAPGMRLRGYSMPFNLHAVPDPAKPYITPEDRGVEYPKYWKIDDDSLLLREMYQVGLFTGMETVNSYSFPISNTNGDIELENSDLILLENQSGFLVQEQESFTPVTAFIDVAVEPNTYGMYIVSSNALFYLDRREYQASLVGTGLVTEPLYGLQVGYDITKTGPTRYVTLSSTPYANSANILQYRYVVDSTNSILPDGSLGPINAGWRPGPPAAVSFPLIDSDDYIFQLQMQDSNGNITYDIVPFKNAVINPLMTFDMSIIDNIVGMAFDSYGQLWVWNGYFAIPIDIHYDGYIYDSTNTTIYVTEPFSSLQITV